MDTPTIIVFGQTGAGKSSLVNMIASEDVAQTSSDLTRCTFDSKPYDVELAEGFTVTLLDTAGLDQGAHRDYDTVKHVGDLIFSLEKSAILLIFCLRGKIEADTVENYQLFRAFSNPAVPIAVVISGMERESDKVEWWKRNGAAFKKANMKFTDHACIAGIRGDPIPNSDRFVYGEAHDASAMEVKALIRRAYLSKPRNPSRQWLAMAVPGSTSRTFSQKELREELKKLGIAKKDCEGFVKAYKAK